MCSNDTKMSKNKITKKKLQKKVIDPTKWMNGNSPNTKK